MKTIFWNVDTQYDFMRSDGGLYVKDAEQIEENLEQLTLYAEKQGIQVVNTGDWHTLDSDEIAEEPDFVNTFPAHCIIDSEGAMFIPATQPSNPYVVDWRARTFDRTKVQNSRNLVLYKDHFDDFQGSPHTDPILKIINPDIAVVYGVATNVCVDFAVLGLLERGVQVYVPLDAIKELPHLPLEETLERWRKAGAKLVTTKDVLEGRLE
jgi:nicotinamidase/pyrazinamidase